VPCRELIQLYNKALQTRFVKSGQDLPGFARIRLLKPGESRTVFLELNARELAAFAADLHQRLIEAGDHRIRMGSLSANIRQQPRFHHATELISRF